MFDVVKELCDKRGVSINDLEEALGYSRNTLYRLKRQNPGADKLKAIADYFDVSVDYLLGREQKVPYTETDLAKMVDNAMSFDGEPIDEHDREVILAFLKGKYGIE